MIDLSKITDAELQREITRRAEEKKKAPKAIPFSKQNWQEVVMHITSSVQEVEEDDDRTFPSDFEHEVFVLAMETVYGTNIWKWWNEH